MNEKYLRQYIRLSLASRETLKEFKFFRKKKEHQYGLKDYLRKFKNVFSMDPVGEAVMYYIEDIEDEFDFNVSDEFEKKIEAQAEKYYKQVSRKEADEDELIRNLIYSLKHDSNLRTMAKKESGIEDEETGKNRQSSQQTSVSLKDYEDIAFKFVEDLETYYDIEVPVEIEQKALELCKKNYPQLLQKFGENEKLAQKQMNLILKKELSVKIREMTS